MTIVALKFSLIESKEHFLHLKWKLSIKRMRTSAIKPPNVTLVSVLIPKRIKCLLASFWGDKKNISKCFMLGFSFPKWACRGQPAIGLLIVK